MKKFFIFVFTASILFYILIRSVSHTDYHPPHNITSNIQATQVSEEWMYSRTNNYVLYKVRYENPIRILISCRVLEYYSYCNFYYDFGNYNYTTNLRIKNNE